MSTIKVGPLDTRNNLSDLASASRAVANLQITFVATGTGTVNVLNGGPLAGTNLKGYIIGANLAFSSRVWTSLRWMSADSIAGPTYKNDLFQFDLNATF